VRNAGGLEFRFCHPVLDAQAHWRNVGMEETRIDDALHFGRLRRLDHIVVLRSPLTNFARGDEKQHIDPRERRFQRRGFGIVGLATATPSPRAFAGERTSATMASPTLAFNLSMTRRRAGLWLL
jgi:hypothetical protein